MVCCPQNLAEVFPGRFNRVSGAHVSIEQSPQRSAGVRRERLNNSLLLAESINNKRGGRFYPSG